MANFSILEALDTLCTSVPEWNNRLDQLNGQIALRQIELARLTDTERPPTRSLKNKGSTESLRPKDGHENPFLSHDPENPDDIQLNPFDSPKSNHNGFTSNPRSAGTAGRTKTPPKASSNPHSSPGGLMRQSSQPTPLQRPGGNVLRKRKTESLASNESSVAPKYRTRSMIIVYYDSAVQTAFEELVKFVSGSRNAMRKGKMATKMAEMKRAAEMEVGDDDDDDEEEENVGDNLVANKKGLVAAQKNVSVSKQGQSLEPGGIAAGDSDSADMAMPKLKFVSTRQMGPSRDAAANKDTHGSTLSVGLLRGYRRAGGDAPDIFDELDKGLEWCQGQCEHAAHQFLRDGECGTEIANIKRKLAEVKETAEKEIEKLNKAEAENPTPKAAKATEERQLKTPLVRRELGSFKDLEVDDMEVDDEGVDGLEPPKLVFKRSRDIGR
ncbi:uncharacterized protein LY89DRAFT_77465 [Mollisia scopiformis]|uniref:Uncharacterized protein n=1 Tax=Mollisia scopiformis TaxID=149040 RepID=A0A194X7S1_MOLSC|nr:uncharacterized protein LY89DRAFT_77465 [Mollisia scopiformis]KUJ16211.1 hypothetical protein LY89DRAFT_77465 [Mollisia scopiformis]